MKLHKHYSEESLKSLNGECVSVPVDQYKQLLRAQEVSTHLGYYSMELYLFCFIIIDVGGL